MNEGKKFEGDFKSSIPDKYFIYKLKDSAGAWQGGNMTRFASSNICDFVVFANKWLFLLELKSVATKRIPLTPIRKDSKKRIKSYGNIKKCQLDGMMAQISKENVEAGFLFNFRPVEETYFVEVSKVVKHFIDENKSSIPLDWCKQYGTLIPQHKKVSRYSYDLSVLFD